MIRVVLPQHLRTLAHVSGEVKLEVEGRATLRSVSMHLNPLIPCCVGRFATTSPSSADRSCASSPARNLSHELPTRRCLTRLPRAEPFLIVGAIAGG